MEFERLGNIISISKGKKHDPAPNREGQNFRYIQIEDLRNDFNLKYTNELGVEVHENDLIIAWDGANAGTIGYGLRGMIGSTLARLRIKEDKGFNTAFIGVFLKKNFSYLRSKTTGATIPHIDRGTLEALKIPVLDYSEQYNIANLLAKAELLITQRRESVDILDEFFKSAFNEMFGNPIKNEKNWRIEKFSSCLSDILAGSSSTNKISENEIDNKPAHILKVSAVTSGRFNPNEFKSITWSQLGPTLISPQEGDLLFSRANTRELVGATCVVYKNYHELYLPDKIWILLVNSEVTVHYIHYLFQNTSFKKILTKNATGTSGSMLNISMDKLRSQKIPIPPIELQKEFSSIIIKGELVRRDLIKSLAHFQNLYDSLSQQAFKGELKFRISEGKLSTSNKNDKTKIVDLAQPPERISQAASKSTYETLFPFIGKVTGRNVGIRDVELIIKKHFKDGFFGFEDLKHVLIKMTFPYDFEILKDFVFDLLRQKKLQQVFADAAFKSLYTEHHPEFEKIKVLTEQMYLRMVEAL
jgi:type I restriction enzyme S subunit